MSIIPVSDLSLPELSPYTSLTQAQLRNRRHPEQGILIAESAKVIHHALDAGCRPISLLMTEKHLSGQGRALIERCGDVPVYTAPDELLEQLTGYRLTRGMLCAMARPTQPPTEQLCSRARRLAVLEGIVDSSNLGAIFRSAAALHMDGVLLSPSCCDPLSRRCVRVSMGTVFQVPWAYLGSDARCWPDEGLALLKRLGFHTAALALRDYALPIDHPRLREPERLALLLGTEGDGLKERTIDLCDDCVIIPMSQQVDSLNVAAAAAVAFWELRVRE